MAQDENGIGAEMAISEGRKLRSHSNSYAQQISSVIDKLTRSNKDVETSSGNPKVKDKGPPSGIMFCYV